jgi:RNA polymerase sigma factor (sigma-70 family)
VELRLSSSFENTHWSLILQAGQEDAPGSARALEQLCLRYWEPLYGYVRRMGRGHEDAQDLVQGFFQHLVSTRLHAHADPVKGRFRTYLITGLRHFVLQQLRAAETLKRGGQSNHLSLEDAPETSMPMQAGPDLEYDRQWALTVLQEAMGKLEAQSIALGQGERFAALKPLLTDPKRGLAADLNLEERTGLSAVALRAAISRLRQAYRQAIRDEIGRLVADPSEIDAELSHLLAALSGA